MAVILLALIAAGQGSVIFLTAWLAARLLGWRNPNMRPILMASSWMTWSAVTLIGYSALSGDAGFMDGMDLMLSLCVVALAATTVFTVVWVTRPATQEG